VIPACFFDFSDILIEFGSLHGPTIKIIASHGAVVGEPDFWQPKLNRLGCQFGRFAGGVTAKRCVHVVVCRYRHKGMVGKGSGKLQSELESEATEGRRPAM